MTIDDAKALHLRWFGTAEIRRPPTDDQLRRVLRVERATWEEAERLVTAERAKPRPVQVFVCRRGR